MMKKLGLFLAITLTCSMGWSKLGPQMIPTIDHPIPPVKLVNVEINSPVFGQQTIATLDGGWPNDGGWPIGPEGPPQPIGPIENPADVPNILAKDPLGVGPAKDGWAPNMSVTTLGEMIIDNQIKVSFGNQAVDIQPIAEEMATGHEDVIEQASAMEIRALQAVETAIQQFEL